MRNFFAAATIVIASAFSATPSAAQNTHSWIATTGNDANTCFRDAPCRSFSAAFSKTNAGGEILCVDAVNFGTAFITKSITVNCEAAIGSKVALNNSGVGIFTITTAASDRVLLRGLDLDTGGAAFVAHGLDFNGAGTLILDRVKITGSAGSDPTSSFSGLRFAPTGRSKLVVADSLFANSGGSQGAGIRVIPSAGGIAQVSLERVTVASNLFGVAFDGSDSTGGINATIKDSQIASNTNDGVIATTPGGGAPIAVTVINSQITNNGFGVRSIGSNVTVRLDGSKVIGNGTGLSGGGALLTVGNNIVEANGANGAFTGSFAFK